MNITVNESSATIRTEKKTSSTVKTGVNSVSEPTPYDKLTLTNSFLFGKIMRTHKDLCLKLLQIILPQLNITEIKDVEIEKYLKNHYPTKGVRLDAYTKDSDGRHYDLEMQMADTKSLPKRARYYSGIMDTNSLLKGGSYDQLTDSYVIFICPFDPFGKNRCLYSFKNICTENYEISLEDGSFKVFLNANGMKDDVSPELREFLDFLINAPENPETGFLKQLKSAVDEARANEAWREEYMFMNVYGRDYYLIGRNEGLEEGLEKGLEEGRSQTLSQMEHKVQSLLDQGRISAEAASELLGQDNPESE